ncbi:hypothetical protein OSSY52_05310 [Tepiditoga spiralis]|uniref:Uncharacterized protein n=1 Tax=Tepiditoga spiralis TaxID=2108365 RepID=A0A7G1G245_9BACT|nr:hypothetical protein [Tepiditoga spiralis]BBE30390.1 hypothetical protein OSSY52_05310 [Tepiditoga spiralis]
MEFLKKLKEVDKSVVFSSVEEIKGLSYPSIIVFKGSSSEYGKGMAILIDFDRVLEAWAGEKVDNDKTLKINEEISEYLGVKYEAEYLDLPDNWEGFNGYTEFFLESGEVDVISMEFEKIKTLREDYIESFKKIIKNVKTIKEDVKLISNNKDSIFKVHFVSAGKMIMFSIDLSSYIKLSNKLKTENEKKFLWLILNLLMKKNLLSNGKQLSFSQVSKGMMGLFIEEVEDKKLKEIFKNFKTIIDMKEEEILSKFNECQECIKYIDKLTLLNKNVSNENTNTVWDMLELALLDYLINKKDSSISTIIKNFEKFN